MVVVLKENPLGTSTASSGFSKALQTIKMVDTLLANPTIAGLIGNIANKFGIGLKPETAQSTPQTNTNTVSGTSAKIDSEKVFNTIISTIDTVVSTMGDIPLSEAKKGLNENKDMIKGIIDKGLI